MSEFAENLHLNMAAVRRIKFGGTRVVIWQTVFVATEFETVVLKITA